MYFPWQTLQERYTEKRTPLVKIFVKLASITCKFANKFCVTIFHRLFLWSFDSASNLCPLILRAVAKLSPLARLPVLTYHHRPELLARQASGLLLGLSGRLCVRG